MVVVIDLNGKTMYVSGTAAVGVVDTSTRLHFRQRGTRVWAHYAGGQIVRGMLIGAWRGGRLTFRYAQREADGRVHGGASWCDVTAASGRVRIAEHFVWSTRMGSGTNVFDEL